MQGEVGQRPERRQLLLQGHDAQSNVAGRQQQQHDPAAEAEGRQVGVSHVRSQFEGEGEDEGVFQMQTAGQEKKKEKKKKKKPVCRLAGREYKRTDGSTHAHQSQEQKLKRCKAPSVGTEK